MDDEIMHEDTDYPPILDKTHDKGAIQQTNAMANFCLMLEVAGNTSAFAAVGMACNDRQQSGG